MWLQQRPSKFLREGALELGKPFREVSKGSKGRGGQAFVLWHLVRAASGEKSLRSLQPMAAPGRDYCEPISKQFPRQLGEESEPPEPRGEIWKGHNNVHYTALAQKTG